MSRISEWVRTGEGGAFPVVPVALLVLIACAVSIQGCNLVAQLATAEEAEYAYVGRIVLGEPERAGDTVTIPIAFEGGAWEENSGIVPIDVEAWCGDGEIVITVITAVAASDWEPYEPAVVLDEPLAGVYRVLYGDPNGAQYLIGPVTVR